MRKILLTLLALLSLGGNEAWALAKLNFSNAQDSKGNALVSGGFYRVILPGRSNSVAFKQNGEYVKANDGLGIIDFMWKLENDGNDNLLISNPAGGYLKFTEYTEGHSKVKTNGTSTDCTAFEMAWCSSSNKTIHLYDPTNGTYQYGGYTCGTVLSNWGGKGNNMGIYQNLTDNGSYFKFERFYQTTFTIESVDVNGVAVESYPATVTINGDVMTSVYYTNSDNPITSFSTSFLAAYYIGGVEKTAEEVKAAINANTSTLTVTVKPKPFVASTNVNPAYYALMISSNDNSWFENTNGTVVNCDKNRSIPAVTGRSTWIWELKQNGTDGYRIYNVSADKYLGGRTATGGEFTLGDVASSNSFIPVYNSSASVHDGSPTILFKDKTNTLWIDRGAVNSIPQPYAHTGGQAITFLRMYKVTFSEGVTVNSVDDVTTIYVKGDGSDSFTLPSNKLFSINSAEAVGHVEAETAIATCSSNITVTVSDNTTKNVKYVLKWSDGTTINEGVNVNANLYALSSESLPSSFENAFVTLSYSPTEIGGETDEVTVTATWNGPMQIADTYNAATAKWYVVDMHSSENQYTWQYDSSSEEIQTPVIAKDNYAGITANNLFCFVGNPYTGFKIYNKAAGGTKTLRKATTGNTIALMSTENDHNLFKFYVATTATRKITNPYCFKLDGDDYYLNKQKKAGDSTPKLYGWTDTDEGSACRFFAPGEYHLAVMNTWNLEAPLGVVGTKSYITTQSLLDQLREARTNITNDPFCVVGQESILNTILNPVRDSESISLGAGYYRIINAFTSFATKPAWYYNSSAEEGAGRIRWSTSALTDPTYQVNSIFKLTSTGNANEYNILSPNAQKSFKAATEDGDSKNLGYLDTTPGAITFTALNPATQFNLKVAGNTRALHAADHSEGAGTDGRIVSWNAGINTCSAWYILPVTAIDIPLNTVGSESYATMALPFGVTLGDGADAYYITIENGRAKANILTEKQIPAGTPVLLRSTTNASSVTATINDAATATTTGNKLVGTYTQLTSLPDGNNYILGDGDLGIGFYKLGEGKIIAANKAYLNTDGTLVKGFTLDFGGEDAVKSINSESAERAIYDLSGRRVKTPARGLYIVNGKKVIVK